MSTSPRAPVKAAIYARCSDVKQTEKDLSIPAQLDAARAEAKRRGWEVVAEYIDASQTGKNDDRARFQEMLRVARTTKPAPFQRIIVWKFSRFMRNLYQSAIHKTMLRKAGVQVCSLNEPTDDSASGRLMEHIIESFDEYYSENLAQDTSRGMRKNASLGFHNGGRTPTGYRVKRTGSVESPKGVLDPDPAMAPLVQRMFRMVLEGEGAASIRRALNKEGLFTPGGKPWSITTVLSILRNPVYTGVLIFGKKTEHRKDGELVEAVRVEDSHPALISAQDFQAVQALIASRTRAQIHPKTLASNYLLSGLLHCAGCGSTLIGHPAKSGTIHYYWCARRMKCGPEACDGKLLNQQAAEIAVADRLRDTVLTQEHITHILGIFNAELIARGGIAENESEAIDAKLDDARKRLERLYSSLETGALEVDVVAPRIKQWKETVKQLEVTKLELTSATAEEPLLFEDAAVRAHVAEMRRLLDHGSVAARRAFLRAWIKRIEVRERTLTIEYTFPVSPFGSGGEFDVKVDEAEVGKGPRKKKGSDPRGSGQNGGGVNAGSRFPPASSGPVLSMGEDGSRYLIRFELSCATRMRTSACNWSFTEAFFQTGRRRRSRREAPGVRRLADPAPRRPPVSTRGRRARGSRRAGGRTAQEVCTRAVGVDTFCAASASMPARAALMDLLSETI